MEEHYTLGALIGLPAAILAVLACLAWLAYGIFLADDWMRGLHVGLSVITLATTVALFVFAWWPFDWTYHKWTPVTGTVTSVDKRLLADGKGMSEMFLITYRDNPQQYRCDDTRCAGVHTGDQLDMYCKPVWQWAATDGWECNFVQVRPTVPAK